MLAFYVQLFTIHRETKLKDFDLQCEIKKKLPQKKVYKYMKHLFVVHRDKNRFQENIPVAISLEIIMAFSF